MLDLFTIVVQWLFCFLFKPFSRLSFLSQLIHCASKVPQGYSTNFGDEGKKHYLMALPFGSIGAFDPALKDWISYSELVDHYPEVNEVAPDSKKLTVFLSTCGPATYTFIRNLVSPASPSSKTYKEITAIDSNHYKPTPSVMVERLNSIDGFVIVENLCLHSCLTFANCHDTVILETD